MESVLRWLVAAVSWIARVLRGGWSWGGHLIGAHRLQIRKYRAVAWAARFGPLVLAVFGLWFVAQTRTDLRIADWRIQALVAFSIQVFATIGFWILCQPGDGAHSVGWKFLLASVVAAAIFVAATYANWAIEGHETPVLPGGMLAGWFTDLAFLPSITLLLSWFLRTIPDGAVVADPSRRNILVRWFLRTVPDGAVVAVPSRRKMLVWLPLAAATCLFLGALFESTLFVHPHTSPPLGQWLPHWTQRAFMVVGFLLFIGAIGISASCARDRARRAEEPDYSQIKWYLYGACVSLVALVPFVIASILQGPNGAQTGFTRAWGAIVAMAIPLGAIPAVRRVRWRHWNMKRLARGAAIAGTVTLLHELLVKVMADSFFGHSEDRAFQLNAELLLTYGGTLLIAVMVEPVARFLDERAESTWRQHDPPDDVLRDALERVRLSGERLAQVDQRWSAWPPSEPSDAPYDEFPTWLGVSTERTRSEIADAIKNIHESTWGTQTLARQLGNNFGRLTNLARVDLVIDLSPSESTDPEDSILGL